jgi:DHA3 family macrolide efflux protein-like MFS transporter
MGLGTLVIGFAPATAFGLALAGMLLAGFMNVITNGPAFALIQAVVEPDMQGRVFTVMMSLTGAMSPLGMAVAGPVADAFGVQVWFVMGGVVCVLMGLSAFFIPAIVHLEDGRGEYAAAQLEKVRVAPAVADVVGE